jgi:hypothetical protein
VHQRRGEKAAEKAWKKMVDFKVTPL